MSGGRPVLKGTSRKGKSAAMAAVPLPGDAFPAGAIVAVQPRQAAAFDAAEVDVLTTLAALASVSLRNADLHESQRNFFTHVTDILVTALDSHLGFHNGHGRRTAQYVNRVGRELDLDEQRLQRLHFAALLHDIGMLKIDRNQQMSPKSCAKHTVLGSRMLGRIRLWEDIAPIVNHHHEWWDGSGYPEGLSADAIPLESRIIAVCDVFDTLLSPTSYKEAWPFAKSVQEIESGAATQFDPDVVAAFRRLVERGEIGAETPS
jgi:putative nucleotidyltransferase with HDIG domain